RHAGDKTFSAADIDFFARIGPLVAAAYRRVLISRHAEMEEEADGPGLVILDGHGRIESATPAGHSWLDQLGHDVCTRGLQTAVNAVEAVARASAIGRVSAPARLRVRTRAGHWLVLHASLLDGRHDGRVGVILEPAHPAEVASILLEGYGLTAREREVVALVLQGRSTREMAWSLGLSPYTIQDHLKSIFGKFGVGSRSELVGRVFHRDYLPRLDRTPVAADGFFAGLPEPAAEIRSSPPRP
ncbi:MAG: helix-turn-helix transcriptional regulator, partial [Chloroflexi bacterium]|nr:helix-turn-helix transcriptional regulator [Chloroflexota bacterium]